MFVVPLLLAATSWAVTGSAVPPASMLTTKDLSSAADTEAGKGLPPSRNAAQTASPTSATTVAENERSVQEIFVEKERYPLTCRGFFQPQNKVPLHNVEQPAVSYDLFRLELSSAFTEDIFWFWRNDLYLDNSLKGLYFARHEVREIYLDWYTMYGDLRLGKQIITWGMADENNPMDNINPVDLYDPFQEKTERKYGIWAVKFDNYFNDYKLTLVWLPLFKASRLPSAEYLNMPSTKELGDPELPEEKDLHTQYGARLLKRGRGLDWSLSYYEGYEKIYSVTEYVYQKMGPVKIEPFPDKLGYYRDRVFGADLAADIQGFDVRGEAAYFITEDPAGEDEHIRNPYYQYIIGATYKFADELKLGANYAEEVITRIDDSLERDQEEANISRMGMQLSMFAPRAMVYILEKEFIAQHVKLQTTVINDLEKKGVASMSELSWEVLDDLTYYLGLVCFGGSEDSLLGQIDENDLAYVKIKYSF